MLLFELLTLSSLCGQWSEKVTERTVCWTYYRRVSYCAQEMGFCLFWLWSKAVVASWNGASHAADTCNGAEGSCPAAAASMPVLPNSSWAPQLMKGKLSQRHFFFAHASWKKWPKRNLSHASTEKRMQSELSHPRSPVVPTGNTETLHPDCSTISTSKPNHPWTEI